MRETPVSTCEKNFMLEALWEGKRLDGRGWMDTRNLDISFGADWGSCQVRLPPDTCHLPSDTRYLALAT